uniref:TPT domain-containing protein n=1 Tax=Syphacia muris TaxID=451379 RepID=A0A0N5AUW8_9BILA
MVLAWSCSEAKAVDGSTTNNSILKLLLIIACYYPLSIGLTFFQKSFLKVYQLPLLVVTGHYLFKYFMALFLRCILECLYSRRSRIPINEQLKMLAPIGICASFDIGLSNWGLEYVTVSLYTMAKSTSILFIVASSLLFRLERWRTTLGFTAAFITSGLFLFTWRASQFDPLGFVLIQLASACAGIRWTVSQLVMQRDDQTLRHPIDMIIHVQPYMIFAIIPLTYFIEGSEISLQRIFSYRGEFSPFTVLILISIGGMLAFAMEISEYFLLVNTSGITLNIFGIIKEVVTLLLAHIVNGDRLSLINLFGLCLCLSGMSLHAISKRNKSMKRVALGAEDMKSLLEEVDP